MNSRLSLRNILGYILVGTCCLMVVQTLAGQENQSKETVNPNNHVVSNEATSTAPLLHFRKVAALGTVNSIDHVSPTGSIEKKPLGKSIETKVEAKPEKKESVAKSAETKGDSAKALTIPEAEHKDKKEEKKIEHHIGSEEQEANLRSPNPKSPDSKVELPRVTKKNAPKLQSKESVGSDQVGDKEPKNEGAVPQEDPERILNAGFPDAAKALDEMYTDLINGMNTRRVTPYYGRWKHYCASVLARTNAVSTGLELNNRNRLSWYEKLYRDPLPSVFDAEEFSRTTYCSFAGGAQGLIQGIQNIRPKLDVIPSAEEVHVPNVTNPTEAISALKTTLEHVYQLQEQAYSPLSAQEKAILARELHIIFTTQVSNGHTLPNVGRAMYLIDVMNKINRSALYDAAEQIVSLTDKKFLKQLSEIPFDSLEQIEIESQKVARITTEAGDILIGGRDNNVWNLDTLTNVICVIDLGGNDTYVEGSCNINRPVLLVLDFGTDDDRYTGTRPGIQGGSIMGVSLWYNEGGNNQYSARDIAQGSTIGGIGILIDNDGNDTYNNFMRGQGTALCGLGVLIDRNGSDDYHSAMLAQGLGHPHGLGLLLDKAGDDHYYVGGYYQDSYEEHPGYDGWGQGIGSGIRQVACGGIGMLFDGGGDDVYEYDYFAHGGGYWMGIGIARDFGGNDKRIGATLRAYNGGPRTQARWQRFSNGFGCHYACGYLFDDQGNDSYDGTIMGLGMAWDLSAGFLVDYDGDDTFEAVGGLTQGSGAEGSIGVLMSYRGKDTYKGRGQGYASTQITYHQISDCGANFSFVIDHGGKDIYGCQAENNSMIQRGMATGFLIDRPTVVELAEMEAEKQRIAEEKGNAKLQDQSIEKVSTSKQVQNRAAIQQTLAPPTVDPPTSSQNNRGQMRFGGFRASRGGY